jgi:hypothetical protein
MGICNFFHYFLRIIFSLSLIILSLKNFFEIDLNKGYINKSLTFYSQNFFPNSSLLKYKNYSVFILVIQNYFLILTGLTKIFGFKISLFFLIIFYSIDIILVHNPLISDDLDNLITSLQYLSLIGGLLNI